MPPHDPYNTHKDFFRYFQNDGFSPIKKPIHPFGSRENYPLFKERMEYDEFILYADREFGRLFEFLESSSLLENTWVIFTSDHGELFERGILGHTTAVLYEPLIRIPLLIFEPGRTARADVHAPTSAIDILPTLLQVTGNPEASWAEGRILPPFDPRGPDAERDIYVLEASDNDKLAPLTNYTISLVKGRYKLKYFLGYGKLGGAKSERMELYDIENDPEEMTDLHLIEKAAAVQLLETLKAKVSEVNFPYL